MTVLKWLVALASVGYLGGLAVLFFVQRSFLFPIPQTLRTTPEAAGFPEAEEHLLTTADGEKVIVWHVPAKAGPRGRALFSTATAIIWPGSSAAFADMIVGRDRPRRPVLSRLCRLERAAERAGPAAGCGGGLCLHGGALRRGPDRRLGLFARHRRRGGAGGRAAGRQADPGSALYVDRGCRRRAVSDRAGALADAGSVSFRRAHRAGHGAASDHAWRTRSHDSDQVRRTLVCARP